MAKQRRTSFGNEGRAIAAAIVKAPARIEKQNRPFGLRHPHRIGNAQPVHIVRIEMSGDSRHKTSVLFHEK
jgi:hypothetical protein